MNEKIDLLSLPAAERLKICKEIHAALEKRITEAKLPVSDDTIIVDKTVLNDSQLELTNEAQKPLPVEATQKASVLNSLLKRIW